MNVLVILIAKHKLALKLFGQRGASVLSGGQMPNTIARGIRLMPRVFDPDQSVTISLEEFISREGVSTESGTAVPIDGVIVLYEQPFYELLRRVQHAVFAAGIPPIPFVENVHNFLSGHFSVLLMNYGRLIEMVSDANRRHAASLPLRNFEADEWRALLATCCTHSLEKGFHNEMTECFHRILRRRGPKRRSKYPDQHFKDDRDRYFQYGHERHSRYETGAAHSEACAINGTFRFGWRLDQDRHFNVSIGDSDARTALTCTLPNCHDEPVHTRNKTHINMFSNDFHA